MRNEIVKSWFGKRFKDLHPLLQNLHLNGGSLRGEVQIHYGHGVAGIIGKRLARKMNLPDEGSHQLQVDITHDIDGLHWGRSFNNQNLVVSLFKPVGDIKEGYWIEMTGPLTMHLTVDIVEGGWYWRCLKVSFLGFPIPLWLIPQAKAYKSIENDKYCFVVQFSLPLLGSLVSYQGLLKEA